jgi:hypothetical protein
MMEAVCCCETDHWKDDTVSEPEDQTLKYLSHEYLRSYKWKLILLQSVKYCEISSSVSQFQIGLSAILYGGNTFRAGTYGDWK